MCNSIIVGVFAIACASIGSTRAEVYPSRPIAMIVPFPPGSAFDVTARVLAEHLQALARATRHRREPDRRLRKHRHRPLRPLGTGRLHALLRWCEYARAQRCRFRSPVRCAEGFRAGLADCNRSVVDCRQKSHGGERPEGADRLAESESGQGVSGNRRPRQPDAYRGHVFPGGDRHPVSLRSLSWRRCGDQRLGRRASRHHDRFGTEFAAACACRHDQGLCCHGQDTPASSARYPNGR